MIFLIHPLPIRGGDWLSFKKNSKGLTAQNPMLYLGSWNETHYTLETKDAARRQDCC